MGTLKIYHGLFLRSLECLDFVNYMYFLKDFLPSSTLSCWPLVSSAMNLTQYLVVIQVSLGRMKKRKMQ